MASSKRAARRRRMAFDQGWRRHFRWAPRHIRFLARERPRQLVGWWVRSHLGRG